MAYNTSYNPDALPAHAEPEQAAQMMGAMRPSQGHGQQPGRPSSNSFSNNNVPPRRLSPANPGGPHSAPPQQQFSGQAGYNYGRFNSPPPPQNYGFGPPPSRAAQNRPPVSSMPPRTPQPGQPLQAPRADNMNNELFPLFRAANASNSGALSEAELGSALVNGDYTSFDPNTVKMMIRMFDKDGNGRVGFDEFVSLWRFLAAWRELFDRFDEDRSGRISLAEFGNALVAFGYRLSQPFVGVLFVTFETKSRRKMGPPGGKQGMSFDLFVQACISLKRMTDVFKKYDDDRDGYVTLSFEEFLTEILQLQQ